jgi:xylulokinase
MKRRIVVGIDVGTSSVKAMFASVTGEVICRLERQLITAYGDNGRAEQDADDYWTALKEILHEARGLVDDIVAIGLSGHTPSVVCITAGGEPTYPVMTWQDTRATSQASELRAALGDPVALIGTSLPWSASACPAKLSWIAEHEPAVMAATRWVLQPKDFLGFRLTGEAISDPWSSKGLCNVLTHEPVMEVFDQIGWSPSVLPEIRQGTQMRGTLTVRAAAELGLGRAGIPVTVGYSDAMCGMLAIGALTQPTDFIITGTSAIVGVSTAKRVSDAGGLYVIPTTCSPLSVVYGPTQSSGAAVEWAARLFMTSIDHVMDNALTADPEMTPTFLPYISGERAPLWRTDVRGSFSNVSVSAGQAEFFAAVLQGISFAERSILDLAASLLGASHGHVILGGHAGNDDRWLPIRLRTLGRALSRKSDIDSTTRGSAILAMTLLDLTLQESVRILSPDSEHSVPTAGEIDYARREFAKFLEWRNATLRLLAPSEVAAE